jgi:hypothetical protein
VTVAFVVAVVALATFPVVERPRTEVRRRAAAQADVRGGLSAGFGMNGVLWAVFVYFVLNHRNCTISPSLHLRSSS